MGKYINILKKTKARVNHKCSQCGETIPAGVYYYKEANEDKFLQSLHSRSFCTKCYEQFGETQQNRKCKKLDDFA